MKPNPVHSFLMPIVNGDRSGLSQKPNAGLSQGSNLKAGYDANGPSLWSSFWREFHPVDEPHERCYIPRDGRDAVDRHWAQFASSLPKDAQLIDLGCGAGIAGRTLLQCRIDLHVAGIDFADVPALRMAGLTIHPGIYMEALPFNARCFDAAISLFGIEYGTIGKTAQELGRVLKPGAHFSFLVHHSSSEIVGEGSARRKALRELLSAKVKTAFLAGSVAAIDQQLGRLENQFPGDPSIDHFSRFLRHHISLAREERKAKWQYLLDGLAPELALLMRLEQSAKSAADMGSWLAPLLQIMNVVTVSILRGSSGEPIAWEVSGLR